MKTIQNFALSFAIAATSLTTVACGGGSSNKPLDPSNSSGKKDASGAEVAKKAAAGFNTASDAFVAQGQTMPAPARVALP